MKVRKLWAVTGSLATVSLLGSGIAMSNAGEDRSGGSAVTIPAPAATQPDQPVQKEVQPTEPAPSEEPTYVAPKVYNGSGSSVPTAQTAATPSAHS